MRCHESFTRRWVSSAADIGGCGCLWALLTKHLDMCVLGFRCVDLMSMALFHLSPVNSASGRCCVGNLVGDVISDSPGAHTIKAVKECASNQSRRPGVYTNAAQDEVTHHCLNGPNTFVLNQLERLVTYTSPTMSQVGGNKSQQWHAQGYTTADVLPATSMSGVCFP